MKRKLLSVLLFLITLSPVFAQKTGERLSANVNVTRNVGSIVVNKNNNIYAIHGLVNPTTSTWLTSPIFLDRTFLNDSYVAFKNADGKWGIYDPKGNNTAPHIYDDIKTAGSWYDVIFLAVKKNTSWGIISYDNVVMAPFKYTNIYYNMKMDCAYWNGQAEKNDSFSREELNRNYITIKNEQKVQAQKEAAALAASKALAEKEALLSSFTNFAKNYVEPRINQWQKKDEFETTAEYRERVTGPNRLQRIDQLTVEAEKEFIKESAAIYANMQLSLGEYDADNQNFRLMSQKFGDIYLYVPRADAPDFKKNFGSYKLAEKSFAVDNDKITLSEFILSSSDGHRNYKYSNKYVLRHNTYVDYENFNFAPVEIKQNNVAAGQKAASPTIEILSHKNGDTYDSREVTFRYRVKTFDGSIPAVDFRVNNERQNVSSEQSKGVARDYEEKPLSLPTSGQCYVMFRVNDGSGNSSTEQITLKYTGNRAKPDLHVLSVGISDYNDKSLQLQLAAKDATDFARTIEKVSDPQYRKIHTPTILTNQQATKAGIEQALYNVQENALEGDVIMLFFSGHGEQANDDAYFLSCDAKKDALFSTSVGFSMINGLMNKMTEKNCKVLIFMDACYAGAMLNTKSIDEPFARAPKTIVGYFSSTSNQKSVESETWKNGVFTQTLIEGINGAANDGNGNITIESLRTYLRTTVPAKTNNKQTPVTKIDTDDYILFGKSGN